MKIRLNVDRVSYKEKPVEYYGAIRNRLYRAENVVELEPDELPAIVEQGRSFTAAVMEQTTREGWREQQILAIDIDNTDETKDTKQPIPEPLKPDEALHILEQYWLAPYFMYYTFSSTTEWPRFRMVFVLDRPITGMATAQDLAARVIEILNREKPGSADPASRQADRMYAGSRPGSVFYLDRKITAVEDLQELPAVPNPEPERREYTRPSITGGRLEEMEAQVEAAINNFDLAAYIESTTSCRPVRRGSKTFYNPCPICGHNDAFNVTGSLYCCFSSGHPGSTPEKPAGGTIIQYLQETRGIDYGEARDVFKYEILRQDPEEWKSAYKEEKQREREARAAEIMASRPAAKTTPSEPRKSVIERFLEKVQSESYRPYETGLPFFDNLLGGGILRQTLLLLQAPPGTGKTTLCQQLAEAIAKQGSPVVYLNLEMSAAQMIAKAISGRTWRKQSGGQYSMTDILQGYKWTPEQRVEILAEAAEYEREILPNLTYANAGTGIGLEALRQYLSQLGDAAKAEQKEAPAVIVDYLHLITAPQRMETQELLKQAVQTLKTYAIERNAFVFAISATNRASNISGQITLESGRDSSALEYSADYVLSLNYFEVDKNDVRPSDAAEMAKLQQANWRKMILRVNKSRFTMPGRTAELFFHASGNTFYDAHGWLPADPERVPFLQDRKPDQRKRY